MNARARIAKLTGEPVREYALIAALAGAFVCDVLGFPGALPVVAAVACLPTFVAAAQGVLARRLTIDAFNAFAVTVSFVTGELRSAGFIALMLCFARLLDWRTRERTRDAVTELLRLKPASATVERDGRLSEIAAADLREGDVVLVKAGGRVPADGTVLSGEADLNEALVTGESRPVAKAIGDRVLGSTLAESGAVRVRVTAAGKDSTVDRMAALMREATVRKSGQERIADRFAAAFLPLVGVVGAITYAVTGDLRMTTALFLVACADDLAVAIPLAMTAALGVAASRGVIVKGGERLEKLGRVRTVVLDKTGTLTYGALSVRAAQLRPGVNERQFWRAVASAEKFSGHPVGRAAYREAVSRVGEVPDPEAFETHGGRGVTARAFGEAVIVGTARLLAEQGVNPAALTDADDEGRPSSPRDVGDSGPADGAGSFLVAVGSAVLGRVTVADVPRPEAAESIRRLRALGVERIVMLTGDSEEVAAPMARAMGIEEYRSAILPEGKLREIERLCRDAGPVAMVGDGVNDAPALARADIGVAMGGGGAAVSVEAADVVIMTDELSRLPEMIADARRTFSVIRGDIVIWAVSNAIGFALVFAGVAGPALAAFYNFLTDFLPILNSTRLFRRRTQEYHAGDAFPRR